MIEYSLGILKPDCAQRGLTKTALEMVRATGLEIVTIKTITLTKDGVTTIYQDYQNDNYFDNLCQFMQSGPVTVYLVRGEKAVKRLNEVVGCTEPSKAKLGTIRSLGTDIAHNLAHSSSSDFHFLREAGVIFSKRELVSELIPKKR